MKKTTITANIPPLLIIGTIIVLFPIFVFMTIDRINTQKAQNIRMLMEKSTALIRAFEAGTYTGMMNMSWNRDAMENLLTETAALPDIAYLFIVDKNGIVLAHSRKEKIGMVYGRKLDFQSIIEKKKTGWRIVEDENNNKVFEVHKWFSPINRGNPGGSQGMMMSGHMRMHRMSRQHWDVYKNTVIFVGLDMTSFTQADIADTRHTIMMAVILALIGFTGFVLVFIVQRYTQARSSLSKIKIFSDTLVENMPVGLIATDMNNQIVSVNPSAVSILNISPELAQKDIYQKLPVEIISLLQSIKTCKGLVEQELSIKGVKEETILLETVASPLCDKEGNSLGTLLILRDKTELSRMKKEVEQNKRLAAIGRLAAGVAHEIRNPLSSLKGYATFFKEVFDPETENYTIADVMTKEVDRLNRVVSELVELAKPVAVSGNPVDLCALIQESVQPLAYEPDAEHIEIKTELDDGLPRVNADADRLKQVLLNLYLNALQAMEGSGTLDITLQKGSDENTVVIRISDTGCGVKDEMLTDIFEPYFTTKLSGTGLGLAVVKNIIKAHNGTIQAESSPGKGTTFTITLPIRTENKP